MGTKVLEMTISKRTLVYTLDAIMIGGIVGVIDTLFGRVLIGIGEVRTDYLLYLLPVSVSSRYLDHLSQSPYGGKSQKGMELLFEVGEGREKAHSQALDSLDHPFYLVDPSLWWICWSRRSGSPTWGEQSPMLFEEIPLGPMLRGSIWSLGWRPVLVDSFRRL